MTLQTTEAECAAVAVAPRVALADIEGAIEEKFYLNAGDIISSTVGHKVKRDGTSTNDALRLLSICILVMTNGFTVIGKSAPASPENFNTELGRKLAYEDAIRQLWPLMGYALRDKLAASK
jgi:hypothetical protein